VANGVTNASLFHLFHLPLVPVEQDFTFNIKAVPPFHLVPPPKIDSARGFQALRFRLGSCTTFPSAPVIIPWIVRATLSAAAINTLSR